MEVFVAIIICNFAFPQLQEHFNNLFCGVFQRLWWFQDGAPVHRIKAVWYRLHEMFVSRVVALYRKVG